jgi:hypothetical protein
MKDQIRKPSEQPPKQMSIKEQLDMLKNEASSAREYANGIFDSLKGPMPTQTGDAACPEPVCVVDQISLIFSIVNEISNTLGQIRKAL